MERLTAETRRLQQLLRQQQQQQQHAQVEGDRSPAPLPLAQHQAMQPHGNGRVHVQLPAVSRERERPPHSPLPPPSPSPPLQPGMPPAPQDYSRPHSPRRDADTPEVDNDGSMGVSGGVEGAETVGSGENAPLPLHSGEDGRAAETTGTGERTGTAAARSISKDGVERVDGGSGTRTTPNGHGVEARGEAFAAAPTALPSTHSFRVQSEPVSAETLRRHSSIIKNMARGGVAEPSVLGKVRGVHVVPRRRGESRCFASVPLFVVVPCCFTLRLCITCMCVCVMCCGCASYSVGNRTPGHLLPRGVVGEGA